MQRNNTGKRWNGALKLQTLKNFGTQSNQLLIWTLQRDKLSPWMNDKNQISWMTFTWGLIHKTSLMSVTMCCSLCKTLMLPAGWKWIHPVFSIFLAECALISPQAQTDCQLFCSKAVQRNWHQPRSFDLNYHDMFWVGLSLLKKEVELMLDTCLNAYMHEHSTEDALLSISHLISKHLENTIAYARILFIDYS